ncbi:hypothetical protein CAOG_06098 [Capsaspora owczarzaki ATCC 30864]|uniref:PA domain-containing protein n=1 Tax=Capsaspora owczarzaki (strain ATCC 30864) TaxID=595528 RepID=A0A0D2VW04_CAPO3|nr:hypothetical protein CAOG_06098 [Capsaspora owczarzaki ATCC 30864]KJE95672.1 hypothetical protein CAOG_006098 [Capsaspora owczarzaki ATCC 30864]|eukprot:XP_004345688.2 hypothetical protein CAOG_06098 [Capsaspora owczarzaki ATCC 30864]
MRTVVPFILVAILVAVSVVDSQPQPHERQRLEPVAYRFDAEHDGSELLEGVDIDLDTDEVDMSRFDRSSSSSSAAFDLDDDGEEMHMDIYYDEANGVYVDAHGNQLFTPAEMEALQAQFDNALENEEAAYAYHTTTFEGNAPIPSENVYFEILDPPEIAYMYTGVISFNIGVDFEFMLDPAYLVLSEPYDACQPLNGEQFHDAVVMVERGTCSFIEKAINVASAGAAAMIVADNEPPEDSILVDMVSDDGRLASIPCVFIQTQDGAKIRNAIYQHGVSGVPITIPLNITMQTQEAFVDSFVPWAPLL